MERLFSAAGLILDAKRSKLDPAWVDHILFLREAFLASQDALEVMYVSQSVSQSVDITDVTLVSILTSTLSE